MDSSTEKRRFSLNPLPRHSAATAGQLSTFATSGTPGSTPKAYASRLRKPSRVGSESLRGWIDRSADRIKRKPQAFGVWVLGVGVWRPGSGRRVTGDKNGKAANIEHPPVFATLRQGKTSNAEHRIEARLVRSLPPPGLGSCHMLRVTHPGALRLIRSPRHQDNHRHRDVQ